MKSDFWPNFETETILVTLMEDLWWEKSRGKKSKTVDLLRLLNGLCCQQPWYHSGPAEWVDATLVLTWVMDTKSDGSNRCLITRHLYFRGLQNSILFPRLKLYLLIFEKHFYAFHPTRVPRAANIKTFEH